VESKVQSCHRQQASGAPTQVRVRCLFSEPEREQSKLPVDPLLRQALFHEEHLPIAQRFFDLRPKPWAQRFSDPEIN
jgi:hypothetical protein